MNNNVVVLGRVSVGKSTLLNAIVGHKYFQMGDGITTTETKTYPLGKLNLIDIPGNIDNNNLIEYAHIIEGAMAVLYVCDAQSVCNTLQMIPQLIAYRRRLNVLNIFPVLNKIDEIDDLNSVRKEYKTVIQTAGLNGIEVIEVSAKMVLLIKLYIANKLDENTDQQLLNYVFGHNGSSEVSTADITQNMINNICKTSGYNVLEEFFERFTKLSEHNLYMEIINNSHLMPIKTYLGAVYRYNLYKYRIARCLFFDGISCAMSFGTGCFCSLFMLLFIYLLWIYEMFPSELWIFIICLVVILAIVITIITYVVAHYSGVYCNKCFCGLNDYILPRKDITCIETTQESLDLISNYYVNSRYTDIFNNPFMDINRYIDKVYFSGTKYSDFVFLRLHDKIYQIHGIFSRNKISEVTYVVEVILITSKNKNPFRTMDIPNNAV
jgi:small GTP-binding protein